MDGVVVMGHPAACMSAAGGRLAAVGHGGRKEVSVPQGAIGFCSLLAALDIRGKVCPALQSAGSEIRAHAKAFCLPRTV